VERGNKEVGNVRDDGGGGDDKGRGGLSIQIGALQFTL